MKLGHQVQLALKGFLVLWVPTVHLVQKAPQAQWVLLVLLAR